MDLSGVIFVALAVAWAAYLIPKALKHHDEVVRSRSVDRFSHTMRVLARREPISRRDARLVLGPSRTSSGPVVETKAHPEPIVMRTPVARAATKRATQRRRRVLGLLLLVNAVVIGLVAFAVIGWVWESIPAGLVVGWLVLCRVMVKKERAVKQSYVEPSSVEHASSVELDETTVGVSRNEQGFDELDPANETQSVPVVPAGDPELWDPLPMTLPTYVTKPAAQRRSVRTISLEDTGVWSSGHADADSAIAREAEQADQAARAERKTDDDRAVGS